MQQTTSAKALNSFRNNQGHTSVLLGLRALVTQIPDPDGEKRARLAISNSIKAPQANNEACKGGDGQL